MNFTKDSPRSVISPDATPTKIHLVGRFLISIIVVIFVIEVIVLLFGQAYFASLPILTQILADSVLLAALLFPVLYFASFRPVLRLSARLQIEIVARTKIESSQEVLSEMSAQLQVCDTFAEAGTILAKTAGNLLPEQSGQIFLVDLQHMRAEQLVAWGHEAHKRMSSFTPSDCWALRRMQMHRFADATVAQPCAHLSSPLPAISLCMPIMSHGELIGLFHIHGTKSISDKSEMELLERIVHTMAEFASIVMAGLQLREKLQNESIRDALTGLFNRRYMDESLEREIGQALRSKESLSLIMMDLDKFKIFNDSYGHAAGDILLQEFGSFLQDQVRVNDIVCRYGGEEFLIIMPKTALETASERAENIRASTGTIVIEHGGQRLPMVTISLGVATLPQHGHNYSALIRVVDTALYDAKARGRNRVTIAGADSRAA